MTGLRRFLSDRNGAAAAEFSLVALLFLSMMLGIIDMARFAWEFNSAKAAARAGARIAIVSPAAAAELVNFDAVVNLGIGGGGAIPLGAVPDYTCTSSGCSPGVIISANFTNIVTAMQRYYGNLQASDVTVVYRHVGLGTAGNPFGSDVEPVITVSLQNITFQPIALQVFGVTLPFPSVSTTLTAEDLA